MSQNTPPLLGSVYTGGNKSALNITAAGVVKAAAGHIRRVVVLSVGSGGAPLVINDATTVAGSTTPTEIFNAAQSALAAITPITLDFPVSNGIVISSMPASARLAVSYD